ncbi:MULTISPECIES: hypothetical protein [Nitrosopumilus]|uniref:Uncharacterized protein n=1 Tax=Nitrosopumilus piranensis TaxID=1582439 RepID=A0A0C5CCD3_9ARCH|nr:MULTISPECIES: hypothetical protein [Nitrosopumilus]AJM92852.1 conserved membrane protein of unknown function [Nitrosopumilus piranensis]KAF6244659.1 hypothetical protein C6989_07245 [Nitrosopumilus sp. b2]
MSRAVTLTILLAGLLVIGSTSPVWAAQMDAKINPNSESSPFKMNYQKTVFIEYPNGGQLFDVLRGQEWTIEGTADSSDPGVQNLIRQLNDKIKADGSQAHISDLNVSYDIHLKARNINTSVDYRVILEGTLTNYVITKDSQKTLVDLGWRGLTANGDVVIDGHEINFPINILLEVEPEAAAFFVGTEAEDVLRKNLINADFILQQPLTNWHFLFDPTGINVDAGTFGLSQEISGFVVSSWTMGESSIREGRQVERVFEAEIVADQPYVVRSVQSSDQGNLYAIGFGALDIFDGVEIAGVTPTPPEDYATTSTGDFPVMIIYGMAAIAAIAGGAFFMFSNRQLKNTKEGQQGIDPSRLQGYQTSASSGGYQTNRGEAQLKDDAGYQQTRSVYDETSEPTEPNPPQPEGAIEEAACGCAASADMGSECDCEMQGACLCDATCGCNAEICKEQANSMS